MAPRRAANILDCLTSAQKLSHSTLLLLALAGSILMTHSSLKEVRTLMRRPKTSAHKCGHGGMWDMWAAVGH